MVKLCFPILGIPRTLPSFLRRSRRKRKKREEIGALFYNFTIRLRIREVSFFGEILFYNP
ncbi:hypothetical protein CH370_15435 [Leptospira kmetyi]|uniref:Uncharacterized protein n=1 Tax=Leptospira kmetyi TaxID=408139 RepID=A0ABX4NCC1_9LEPT|nr:hypothetical protein LEP1GSC052_2794 [Leptospira kmetyi serovar Malaysia str. Bejo-Iso9]PJZ30971.1 hypothetical protein CH378_04860 [Leptospira kmetyi]PJZ40702.1 hypothetical protein CH370_15435 [Leptospira kmetyi]